MKKTLPALALSLALAFTMSACSDNGTVEKGGAESSAAETSAAAESTAEASNELQFGDKYTYENGVSLAISKPEAFKPSETGLMLLSDPDGKDFVSFDVTIVNGSDEAYDPNLTNFTASSDGEEAEQIFDTDNKLNGSPSTTVKPGKSVKFKIGFAVADKGDITMDASPGMEYSSKTFMN